MGSAERANPTELGAAAGALARGAPRLERQSGVNTLSPSRAVYRDVSGRFSPIVLGFLCVPAPPGDRQPPLNRFEILKR